MATATQGHLGEFDSAQEEWKTYTERLEQYFTANDVRDAEKQRATLLSCVARPHIVFKTCTGP